MSSTFTGITTALNSLMAQRRALDVTGQNIANASTVGYTRQRADLQAVASTGRSGLFTGSQSPGWGVQVTGVSRLSEALTDARQRDAHGTSSFATARQSALARIEGIVNEPSDDGLSAQLSQFWTSWQTVANAPGATTAGLAARNQLLSQAGDLSTSLQSARAAVGSSFADGRADLDSLVRQVNATATGIADLNDKIRVATASGSTVNEMADQRDVLVLQLADLVGASSVVRSDGTADVTVGGSTLVSGNRVTGLAVAGARTLDGAATDPVRLVWADGSPAATKGGRMGGMLSALGQDFPNAAAGYDALAGKLITTVNALHVTGKNLAGATGAAFFSGTDARDIGVALTRPVDVAAAGPTESGLGNAMADRISQLRSASDGPDSTWASFVAGVGVQTQAANRQVSVQASVLTTANANRDSASGVSIDEEMTNMLMYQRAYEGAARVMTTVDEMLQTLINIGR